MTNLIHLSLLFLSLSGFLSDCKDFRHGTFVLDDHVGNVYTIVRKGNIQTEEDNATGHMSEFKIKWVDECSYVLYDRKVIKGVDDLPAEFANKPLYCRIIKIQGNTFSVACKMEGEEEIITPPIEKIK